MKIAIVGAGKLGLKITEALLGGNHSVTVIDKDAEVLQKLDAQMDVMTIHDNGKKVQVLRDIDAGSYDYLIAVTDRDEKNIVIAAFAKRIGCAKVIARVRDPEHTHQIEFIKETMDIDYLINPDLSIAAEIYKYLVEKYTLSEGFFSTGSVALLEFDAHKIPGLAGMEVRRLKSTFPGMLLAAISRNGKVILPHGDTILLEDDCLYLVGEKDSILQLSAKVRNKGKHENMRKVMIAGGGKTGLYLAERLVEFGSAVKLVEVDKMRCQYLAETLNHVMVLCGDATDVNLLREERLEEMDAFISVTGYDEDNLLLALIAKKAGVEDVIAKVSRDSYSGLIEGMGVDMALNPLEISTSNVLRYMQGASRVIGSQLIQGQAELVEIIAAGHMWLLGKPLKDLSLPDGIRIGAIHRGAQVIIPDGGTMIRAGDKVIILCLLSELPELEKLLRPTGKLGFF